MRWCGTQIVVCRLAQGSPLSKIADITRSHKKRFEISPFVTNWRNWKKANWFLFPFSLDLHQQTALLTRRFKRNSEPQEEWNSKELLLLCACDCFVYKNIFSLDYIFISSPGFYQMDHIWIFGIQEIGCLSKPYSCFIYRRFAQTYFFLISSHSTEFFDCFLSQFSCFTNS